MRLGLYGISTDASFPFASLASEAEQRGFDSIFIGEHSHLPISPEGLRPDGVPGSYGRILDPFLTLTSAASLTTNIRLGTGVCTAGLHDPIRLAKTVSTLDFLSHGRFVFGTGYGSLPGEMINHGVEPRRRRGFFRDKMLAMQEIWSHDVAIHTGPHASFNSLEQYPKPLRGIRPPTLLGAKLSGQSTTDIVDFCDGWMPISARPAELLAQEATAIRRAWADAGRNPDVFEVILLYVPPRRWGNEPEIIQSLRPYRVAAIDTLCLPFPPERDDALSRLDKYQKCIDSLSAA